MIIFNALAWLAGIVLIFSRLRRNVETLYVQQFLMGGVFGIAAIVAILDPVEIGPGVQIDGRNMFVGFAGAFSGPLGATIALLMTAGTRMSLGGVGVMSALSSMAFCAAMGLVWAEMENRKIVKSPWKWLMLAAMISASIPLLLVVPGPVGMNAFLTGGPLLFLAYTAGTLILGPLLFSEYEVERSRKVLRVYAETDPLTGALNRRGLQTKFEEIVANRSARDGRHGLTMIMIDLDHFKDLNDQYGHDAGDLALQELVQRLRSNLRSHDLVARIGGDEFAACISGLTRERAEQLTKHLLEQLRLHLKLPGVVEPVEITVSIGAIHSLNARDNMSDMLKVADQTMMSAKLSGRNRCIFYELAQAA